MLNFIRLSRENVDELSDLRVADNEKHLIATNVEWLAQAAFISESVTYGAFSGVEPVGLISLIDPRMVEDEEDLDHAQENHLYVWRVMVDRNHRGRGYGAALLNFALGYAGLVGLSGVSLTTMDLEKGNALKFYERLGFTPTGRRLGGEIELILTLPPKT